ncbi:hypothetical protein AB9K34_20515 [Sedimentitalea sp. XS_ASV28]|uniref:hypothetical protein n=1 Tax=Sedimentitalea sp. XS_ASV28 TaxID=3241296 RepID=UPI0035183D74
MFQIVSHLRMTTNEIRENRRRSIAAVVDVLAAHDRQYGDAPHLVCAGTILTCITPQ